MIEAGLEGVEFAANTDAQDLRVNKADAKFKSNELQRIRCWS